MSDHRSIPGPETSRDFRDALGCYGTGVAVVTTMAPDGPLGMTANSFASVSLVPPLVLWSPAKSSRRHDAYMNARMFAIHVLGETQHSIAEHFARQGNDFNGIDWVLSPDGVPTINGCLARFECQQTTTHDAGDHTLILGQVLRATHGPGQGLIFKRGRYGGFLERR